MDRIQNRKKRVTVGITNSDDTNDSPKFNRSNSLLNAPKFMKLGGDKQTLNENKNK